MSNLDNIEIPENIINIITETNNIGFDMVSEPLVGSLLKTLAMSKPSSRFLELGTGTGVSTAWILKGMDTQSTLVTVDDNDWLVAIAQKYLDHDLRVTFHLEDAGTLIEKLNNIQDKFDMIFADTWAGKYTHFDETIELLKSGGLYIIDDMLPQTNWPQGHEIKVNELILKLEKHSDLSVTKMNWASGVILATKR